MLSLGRSFGLHRSAFSRLRYFSSSSSEHLSRREIDLESPIKFSSSKASEPERPPWMLNKRLLPKDSPPKGQAISIYFSVVAILIYFCMLRKENDIDEIIFKNQLYEKVEGLEKQDLLAALNHAVLTGTDSRAIRRRLKEIEEEEMKGK